MVLKLLTKRKGDPSTDAARARVKALLEEALAQRARFHVQFDPSVTSFSAMKAALLSVNAGSLRLELDGVRQVPSSWLGAGLTCYFKLVERGGKHREIFYSFAAAIEGFGKTAAGASFVTVPLPDALAASQRRKSLRVKPDLRKFKQLDGWRYDGTGFDMAKPAVGYVHFQQAQAVLDDLSAGGLRLTVKRSLLKESGLAPARGDRFVLRLAFAEAAPRSRDELWLVAKVSNVRPDPVSGDATLGLEFIASGAVCAESGKVVWTRVTDNVIEDIAARTWQWHIDLYRDKGLAGT